MTLSTKSIHRFTAILLLVFIISHLSVHLFALAGAEAHQSALKSIQWLYRHPIGETILALAIITQIVTGARRLRFKRLRGWAKAQMYSGCYLLFFLFIHSSAAIYTHSVYGLETDFYWAAGTVNISPIKYGFMLYYFAGVLAFFVHMTAAVRMGWPRTSPFILKAIPIGGALIAILILASLSGAFYNIEIPADVMTYFEKNFGFLDLK